MTRYDFLAAVFGIAVAVGAIPQYTPPHIVFVLADDYGFNDISYHARKNGNDTNIIETPHMDNLAASGVKLENYYVQAVCSPTRAAIMTGRYATHTGIHVPLVDSAPGVLPNDEVLLPQLLKKAGYATHMVGKWHLGFRTWGHTPIERGFDTHFGYFAGSTDYWKIESLCWAGPFPDGCFEQENGGEPVTACDLHRNYEPICNNTKYSTELFTEEAASVIAAHAPKKDTQPLFLYLAHQAVHIGNFPTQRHPEYWVDQAPARYIEPYAWVQDAGRRNLSAMVSALDESVGNVSRALKDHGMWDNTLLVFSTDNGGPTSASWTPPGAASKVSVGQASNFPYQKGKGTNWEGGVKGVGFVAGGALRRAAGGTGAGAGALPPGYENRAMMHVSDWLPTLCEVAGCAGGGTPTGTKPLDGVSAWGAIARNESSKRDEILHDTIETNFSPAIRVGDWKLLGPPTKKAERDAARARGEEIVYALYNLAEDPTEQHDLAAANPAKVAELMARIEFYNSTAIAPCDRLTPDPHSNPLHFGGVWTPWSNDTRPGCPQTGAVLERSELQDA
eukprot:g4572.t1